MTILENVIRGCGLVKQPRGRTQFLVYFSCVYVIVMIGRFWTGG